MARDGPNAIPAAAPTPLWKRVLEQLSGALVRILIFALAIDLGMWVIEGASTVPVESIAIAAILVLNTALGVYQEYRSEAALAQLSALAAPVAWVLRDGSFARLPSREIVSGDLVRIEAGERVPADGVLLEAEGVSIDESILTGESVPVEKELGGPVASGTLVARGKGLFEVQQTGPRSTMGRIAAMIGSVQAVETPLERRLEKLGRQIAVVVGGLAVLLAIAGLLAEGFEHLSEVLLFAVALAVAAVPEGMAAVVTLTLALGVQRMAGRKAVVRRLAAVEALGSVTVIATDKTGTLTENKMRVHGIETADREETVRAMVLANDADDDGGAGDPLELGLLAFAKENGVDVAQLRARLARKSSRPFDSAWKFMRVSVDDGGTTRSYLKGAPEVILPRCALNDEERSRWSECIERAASAGQRVLAMARGQGAAEDGLELLGLVYLWDPPRAEVPKAIEAAQRAGIRVVMITGDHPGTARAVSRAIGMPEGAVRSGAEINDLDDAQLRQVVREANVFARVSPDHKLRLVEALRACGNVVAMTGDGVNDAPALKRSDVGISMGQRGSDVAREVSDLVLLDDNFATIVTAIEEGRGIYQSIQAFLRFTFSTNVALVMLVVVGAVGAYVEGLRDATGALLVPLTALQLLWINVLGDGPPALALAFDRSPEVMKQPPRPAEAGLLDLPSVAFVLVAGVLKGALGLVILLAGPLAGLGIEATRTFVFHYHALAKLVTVFPARRVGNRPLPNMVLLGSVLGGLGLQALAVLVPPLGATLAVVSLAPPVLVAIAISVLVTWVLVEVVGAATAAWLARRGERPNN